MCLDGGEDRWDEVHLLAGGGRDLVECRPPLHGITTGAQRPNVIALAWLDGGVDLQRVDACPLIGDEAVHPDDDLLAAVDRLLRLVGGILNLALDGSRFDGAQDSALRVDFLDQIERVPLDVVGEPLDGVGACHRVDGVGHAGFRSDDLLGPQGELGRLLGWQPQRFVPTIAMK